LAFPLNLTAVLEHKHCFWDRNLLKTQWGKKKNKEKERDMPRSKDPRSVQNKWQIHTFTWLHGKYKTTETQLQNSLS